MRAGGKNTRSRTLGLISLLLAAPAWATSELPATLSIGTQGTPIIPAAVNGFNVGYDMSVAEALPEVRSVAPTSLRYPPGNVGDEQDLTLSGLTSFRSTVQLAGTPAGGKPLATVETRVFATRPDSKNKPEDAAQAARDARTLGLKVAYWEIGNEPDLYSRNRGDASWTPERYCQTFRDQRAAILAVDPEAKFAGPAVSNGAGDSAAFLAAFVRGCGDIVDLLTWHEYPTDGTASDEDALATAPRMTTHLNQFRALLDDPLSNPLGSGRRVPLGVTEYSLSYVSVKARHLSDMVSALWTAETTLRLAEGGAALSQYFALIGSGGHGLVDLAVFPRPTLYAFQMLRSFQGEWLSASSSGPELWVHAARQARLLSVLVSNVGQTGHDLNTAVPGYTLIGAKTFTEQTATDERPPSAMKLEASLNLAPRSMTRLAYKRLP